MTAADVDVLVVGGGPVGLAAAIEARLAGLSVAVVEPRSGTIDKACGEGLMPGTLAALQRLGVDPPGHVIAGISYRAGARHVDHRFATDAGRGVRRTVLHAALLARAHELGAVHVSSRAGAIELGTDHVSAAGVSARWLLGCDGLHSTVRRSLGWEVTPRRAGRRYGLRRHVAVAPWSDLVEVHWGPRSELYVTPVDDSTVGVAVLGPRGSTIEEAVASAPELAERLADHGPASELKGAGPLLQRTSRRALGRVRLVGDASGYVDALTGEGLRVGLAQARVAVATLDDPEGYERAWRRETRDYRLLTTGLVAWARSPARSAVVPVARAAPGVYAGVVERLAR
ncbi:FAD-dependent monooxygenase [Actinotalea sp. C106]|uniref:NAD(P)/FAD-dependent oxidoreductase n=1 Tax=Actinotalea sp. C106 TaxID=2908644 RepID=UPI002028E7CD|nr:FAD-dependent monooxygenase [Actinotalea sp. C106]